MASCTSHMRGDLRAHLDHGTDTVVVSTQAGVDVASFVLDDASGRDPLLAITDAALGTVVAVVPRGGRGAVVFYDVAAGAEVARVACAERNDVAAVAFAPAAVAEEMLLGVASVDGVVRVYSVELRGVLCQFGSAVQQGGPVAVAAFAWAPVPLDCAPASAVLATVCFGGQVELWALGLATGRFSPLRFASEEGTSARGWALRTQSEASSVAWCPPTGTAEHRIAIGTAADVRLLHLTFGPDRLAHVREEPLRGIDAAVVGWDALGAVLGAANGSGSKCFRAAAAGPGFKPSFF